MISKVIELEHRLSMSLQRHLDLESRLYKYQKAINQLDDYFEYANESKKDRAKVHAVLAELTESLRDR